MLLRYKKLEEENKALKAENEALKKVIDQMDRRMVKQWENFFNYDGSLQGGSLNDN